MLVSNSDKSEWKVEVVTIQEIKKHPNADTLGIVDVAGYPVIVKLGQFMAGDLAVYIPIDSLVPTSRPEFSFLAREKRELHRIRAIRLRGVFSMGLLIPYDVDLLGEGYIESLGITKYIPPSEQRLENILSNNTPKIKRHDPLPVYGLDGYRRFKHVLKAGESVVITEKIHGTNARYCWHNGRFYVGSHKVLRGVSRHRVAEWFSRTWLKLKRLIGFNHRTHLFESAGDVWWEIAEKYSLKEVCKQYPEYVFYGEIYGDKVQNLTYDCQPGERRIRFFDIMDLKSRRFLDWCEFQDVMYRLVLPHVPILEGGILWDEKLESLSSGKSLINNQHIREGIVIKPVVERFDPEVGRVGLKLVSEEYLLSKES